MTLHEANQMTLLLEQLQALQESMAELHMELAEIRAQLESDNAGDEWKEGE